MGVLKTNFDGNPSVGLYGFATDKYCLMGKGLKKKVIEQIEGALGVPVYTITINNSPLVGAYCVGNEEVLFVPEIIKEHEEKELEKLGIPYKIIKSNFSALGNNLVIKEDCLANPEFEDDIGKKLGLKVVKIKLGGHNAVGSCVVSNSKGCLVNSDIEEKGIKEVEKILGLDAGIGSVNRGNPYVRSGIICNSNGYILGGETTGAEVLRIENALGFNKK
jgi:translation initiation factor 6